MREEGFCAILIQTARKSLILNGEMSEWLKEHAWRVKRASVLEEHQDTSFGSRFNGLRRDDAARCEPVNPGIRRRVLSPPHTVLTHAPESLRQHLFR
jgi:hypothetical protein